MPPSFTEPSNIFHVSKMLNLKDEVSEGLEHKVSSSCPSIGQVLIKHLLCTSLLWAPRIQHVARETQVLL